MRQSKYLLSVGLALVAGVAGCTSEPSISIVTKPMPPRVSLAPQVTRTRTEVAAARPAPPPPAAPAPVVNPTSEKTVSPAPSSPASAKVAPRNVVSNAPMTSEAGADEDEVAMAPAPAAPPVPFRPAIAPSKYKRPPMPAGMPSWFDERDQDQDGMVGMYEWQAEDLATFRKYDLNGDGFISIEEALRTLPRSKVVAAPSAPTPTTPAPAVAAAPPAAMTAPAAAPAPAPTPTAAVSLDENDLRGAEQFISRFGGKKLQGKLAADEVPSWLPGRDRFAEFDKDKDGYLDNNELATMFKTTRGQRGGFGGGGGNRDPEAMVQRMYDRIKERGGGKVTIDAWTQSFMPRDQFAEFDTNKDGVIDFEEFKSGFSRTGGMFGRGGPRRGPGQ
jgi:Ca2+-binding EF-hand superfamily protein